MKNSWDVTSFHALSGRSMMLHAAAHERAGRAGTFFSSRASGAHWCSRLATEPLLAVWAWPVLHIKQSCGTAARRHRAESCRLSCVFHLLDFSRLQRVLPSPPVQMEVVMRLRMFVSSRYELKMKHRCRLGSRNCVPGCYPGCKKITVEIAPGNLYLPC